MILGDIFDNRKAIDIAVSNLAIDILEEIRQICELVLMTGNHDLSKKTNNGYNSLRMFSLREDVAIINTPTEIIFGHKTTDEIYKSGIAIPYMGDINEELKILTQYNKQMDYAFMHTEISAMQMDNGMSIVSGVNPDAFSGHIWAGHIHKRQESKKVTYVGNPFQMSRGDVNNDKGFYCINLKTGESTFYLNDYSPKFQNINIDYYVTLDINQRKALMDNNYNFIIIDEKKLNEYKKRLDIYNLKEGTTARMARPIINRSHKILESELDISAGKQESTIDELIVDTINNLEGVSDIDKKKLLDINWKYFKNASESLSNEN